jgi:hypothetical protein
MIAVLALLPAGLVGGAGSPAGTAAPPGMTWDSIKQLPDFSGWWGVTVAPVSPGKPRNVSMALRHLVS